MTTVVYRDGVLAADSRITECQGSRALPYAERKIFRLPDGGLVTWTGGVREAYEVIEALLEGEEDLPEVQDTTVIRIDPKGRAWVYEGKLPWLRQKGPYAAWGTGAPYAYGALFVGASAEEAVKAGIKFDSYSGGPVRSLKV